MNSIKQRVAPGLVLVAGMLVGGIACASPITMDFDGLTPGTSIDNYYDGGCSKFLGFGVDCGGPDYGVVWQGAKVRSIPGANEPSDPNFMGLGLVSDHATMNVADGFDSGLSFYYTTVLSMGRIKVFDGLDGAGTVLADMQLPFPGLQCGDVPCWDFANLTFSGLAKSAVFYGAGISIGFDNVTLDVNAQAVPEPAALGMFGLGALLLGLFTGLHRRVQRT